MGATLREIASASGELGLDGGVGGDPVCEGVFAVLDDAINYGLDACEAKNFPCETGIYVRFASLVAIVCVSRLARSDRGIIDQLKQVLPVARDDGQFLAVLTQSIELVGEGCLELLAGDVGELSFCNERLSFGTDELLLENDDARRIGFFVFQLGDLVGNFLFAVTAGLNRGFDIANALDGDAVLIVAVDKLVFELADFINQDTELVGDIRDVVIAGFTPDG